jgi:hypothetical protein
MDHIEMVVTGYDAPDTAPEDENFDYSEHPSLG